MPLHSPVEITVSTSITPDRWRSQPWKNGRGTTSEVIRVPDADDYQLRLSVAEVIESGPFSTFPGYTRWSFLLDGGPVWLNAAPLVGVRCFDGATPIEARVDGRARLLNVIGRGIDVGVGEAVADLVFDLGTHVTQLFDVPTRVTGLWVTRTAR
jgi:environmental stress-induced protein Ves